MGFALSLLMPELFHYYQGGSCVEVGGDGVLHCYIDRILRVEAQREEP